MLTPEQLEARKGLITSSVAAACLGLSPYETPMQAKLRILGLANSIDNSAIERGHELEDAILRYPAKKLGLIYEPAPFVLHGNGWSADSCDAYYYQDPCVPGLDLPVMLGEGKSAALGASRHFGEMGSDEIPVSAWVQSHWHLIHHPEVPRCVVPVLIGGYTFEFRLYYVDRDENIEGEMMQSLAKWHRDYIIGDKDPPLVSGDLDWLKEKHPENTKEMMLIATSEIEALARKYQEAKASLEAAEKDAGDLRAQLQGFIAEYPGLEYNGGKITWKRNKSSLKTDWEGLAMDIMKGWGESDKIATLSRHTREAPGARVFRLWPEKKTKST